MWRKASAIAVAVATLAALYEMAWIPLHCNRIKGHVDRATAVQMELSSRFQSRAVAIDNITRLEDCIARRPRDVSLLAVAAANFHLIGNYRSAKENYCGALRYDRRPELYLACGEMQLLDGERRAALDNFVRAGEFAGLRTLSSISDGELRLEAHRIVGTRLEQNLAARGELDERNLVANGTFSTVRHERGSQETTQSVAEAPVEFWMLVHYDHANLEASIQPSMRRPAGQSLRVRAAGAGSGILQTLAPGNRRPRVIASAWVYVYRGTVCLGSGNGKMPLTNVCSQSTGRWEKLEAMNEACPALMVTIVSGKESDGADFVVDEVRARMTHRAPCGLW
jgi:hypothetical protein